MRERFPSPSASPLGGEWGLASSETRGQRRSIYYREDTYTGKREAFPSNRHFALNLKAGFRWSGVDGMTASGKPSDWLSQLRAPHRSFRRRGRSASKNSNRRPPSVAVDACAEGPAPPASQLFPTSPPFPTSAHVDASRSLLLPHHFSLAFQRGQISVDSAPSEHRLTVTAFRFLNRYFYPPRGFLSFLYISFLYLFILITAYCNSTTACVSLIFIFNYFVIYFNLQPTEHR